MIKLDKNSIKAQCQKINKKKNDFFFFKKVEKRNKYKMILNKDIIKITYKIIFYIKNNFIGYFNNIFIIIIINIIFKKKLNGNY
jgi:hypothetical protein